MKTKRSMLSLSFFLFFLFGCNNSTQETNTQQNETDSNNQDIALLAQESKETLDVSKETIEFQTNFREILEKAFSDYPDQVSSYYSELKPIKKGYIRFVGAIPNDFVTTVKESGLIIMLSDSEMYTLTENKDRALAVSQALANAGFNNTAIFFALRENTIQIELKLPKGTPAPSKQDIALAVKQNLTQPAANLNLENFSTKDFDLKILRGEGAIVTAN